MLGGLGGGGTGGGLLQGLMGGLGGGTDNSGGGGCKKYKIISARGTGENQARPTGYAGFISGVLSAVPDGGNYEVRYAADVNYATGPGVGAADAIRYITEQHSSCPKQMYVLIGYSEGAMVITQLMNKPSLPAENVVAVVMYGNPYFKGGAPQNSCGAKGGAGVAAATGISMPAKFSSITFDCCNPGDMVCQTAGTMITHLTYPRSANEQAAIKFAVEKIKAGKGVDAGSGGTSTDSSKSAAGGGLQSLLGGLGGGGGGLSNLMGGMGGLGGSGLGGLGGGGGGLPGLGGLGGGSKRRRARQ
ncbi:hypothetical protein CROQUDRAFT_651933 [Cronartium quercuum f. sp. fusiforme G11]|uniref:Cutinase n=1 Tax=Cronartium quercuum f. sp. fusiforme G11 TaxID=708437 RepID=A0A9P6NP36_9BASI|nr:hypothetical protein CROQUDRAFT_651933 [Cronartium quercuum f. sp. fusiforme G11]